jgi:HPt (histidine-containing phosphotransfer) domain-containing protein
MTLKELYEMIDADYQQAIRVLRMDKLLDKHIRKLVSGGVIDSLLEAEENMDPKELFERSHAVKGIAANLGLTKIADLASVISEEFRPGNPRRMSDEEVHATFSQIRELYAKTVEGIRLYENS